MLESPHVAVGAAIATKIPNPLISIPLAFMSHFVLERVPHWNPHLNTELKKHGKITKKSTYIVVADATVALAIGFFFASRAMPDGSHALTILATSMASVLPDVIEGPYFFFKAKSDFIKKWVKFQKSIQFDSRPLPGLLTQAVTVAIAFFWAI